MEGTYTVKTNVFEGPLDLLLDLVEKRKLFISDVSLAAVTDDFIHYIQTHEEFPLDESAEFIVIASTLMLVKSRSLLPGLPLSDEEESSIDDLEDRLRLYARAKELGQILKALYDTRRIHEARRSKRDTIIFSPDQRITPTEMLASIERVIQTLPKKEKLPKAMVQKIMSLEEMVENLSTRMSQAVRMSFSDFAGVQGTSMTHEKKVTIIVGFLAMLELVKQGIICVTQEDRGEIEMEKEHQESTLQHI